MRATFLKTIPVLFLAIAVGSSQPVHSQVSDTTPPVLTVLDFIPKTIDTSSGPATMTLNLSVTDDLRGAMNIGVLFESPTGTQIGASTNGGGVTSCNGSVTSSFSQIYRR